MQDVRVFLYQPRMNSYNEKKTVTETTKQEKDKYINTKRRFKIKNTKINNYFQNSNNKHYEKRVCRRINGLIRKFKHKD